MIKMRTKRKLTRAQVESALESAKTKLSRLDKRLARLSSMKSKMAEASNATERNQAILNESVEEFVAEFRESHEGTDTDFESLHIDFLLLDEAQNMKNLWPVGRREGGIPKYLGAISEGSDRALDFAIRAFLTQRETGGSGVALLSATPAKNSPLEFFTLLGFVDHFCWTRRNILDPEYFIDRYLRLELKSVLKPDGRLESRTVVVGFMHLNEMRDTMYRYGDFKDARDVGLKLPASTQHRVFLAMSDEQKQKYAAYRSQYQDIVTSHDAVLNRNKALALLQKMALVALHPELDDPPVTRSKANKEKKQWSWANSEKVRNPESPKLAEAVRLVMQRPECGHIIFCDNVAIHRWLRGLLIAAGLSAARIAVLNADQAKTPLIRQEIAEGFNGIPAVVDPSTGQIEQEAVPPRFDIVIANAVAYEGIDLQVRTCRVIHLDLPFEPATLQQRNGRAVRQGNMEAVIEIIYLLSEKSYDAVKLGMITGKLRWMSDILKGADRETNNPAAGMDLSTEDLLLMLADDPEAAKAAMEEVHKRNELERRRKSESAAWQRLSDLLSFVRMAARRDTELEREQARKQALAALDYLREVPSDVWPWLFVAEKAAAGVPMATVNVYTASDGDISPTTLTTRAVWEGLFLLITPDRGAYFSVAPGGVVCLREQGDFRWSRPAPMPKGIGNAIGLAPVDGFRLSNPPDDSSEWRASLQRAVRSLRFAGASGITSLQLSLAPDYWRQLVWAEYAGTILQELALSTYSAPIRSGSGLAFADRADAETALPPTDAGWLEMLERTRHSAVSFSQMSELARAWWGREFPRGLADERAIATLRIAGGDEVNVRLASAVSGGFAVAEVGTQDWRVVSVAGRFLLPIPFRTLEAARLGVRFLTGSATDATQISLDPAKTETLLWVASQSDLPTLPEITARMQQVLRAAQ